MKRLQNLRPETFLIGVLVLLIFATYVFIPSPIAIIRELNAINFRSYQRVVDVHVIYNVPGIRFSLEHHPVSYEVGLSALSVRSKFATPWKVDNFVFTEGLKLYYMYTNGAVPTSLVKTSERAFFDYLYDFSFFKPVFTAEKRLILSQTMKVFFEICSEKKLSYFVCGDTLLGVQRHHGFVPWTGSAHVCMNESDWISILHALSRVPGYRLEAYQTGQLRFSPTSTKYSTKTLPYLQISLYAEDDVNIWLVTPSPMEQFLYKKSDMLPFVRKRFDDRFVSAPKNTEAILDKYFGNYSQECRSDNDLVKNYTLTKHSYVSVPCELLHVVYPFVFVDFIFELVHEELRIGNVVYNTVF